MVMRRVVVGGGEGGRGGCNHLPSLVHPHAVEDIRLQAGGTPSGVPVATARTFLEVTLAEGRFLQSTASAASLGILFKETDVYWRRKVSVSGQLASTLAQATS